MGCAYGRETEGGWVRRRATKYVLVITHVEVVTADLSSL